MNGIPQLPTPSQFLFSLPDIREKVSMRSLKVLMYRHQGEQASTAPKASELPAEAQAVTAPPPAGLTPPGAQASR